MYGRAIQVQWPCSFPPQIHHSNVPRNVSPHPPVYITNIANCGELFPILSLDQVNNPAFSLLPNGGILTPINLRHHSNKVWGPPKEVPVRVASPTVITPRSPKPKPNESLSIVELDIKVEPPKNCDENKTIESEEKMATSQKIEVVDLGDSSESEKSESQIQKNRGLKRHLEASTSGTSTQDSSSPSSSPVCQAKRRLLDSSPSTSVKNELQPIFPILRPTVILQPTDSKAISDSIWNIYLKQRQSEDVFKKKINLRDALFRFLSGVMPNCGLYIVGSSLTSLGGNNSDLDLCLMISLHEINQEVEAINILKVILRNIFKCSFVYDPQLICAKVPILKFKDSVSGIEVDLNVNNAVGIRNTQLLNCYGRLDSRFAPLSIFIKFWAQQNDINDARNMTLSSYSLVLMLIHFLQHRCNPPVLPCLQKEMPDKFQVNADVRHMVLKEEIPNFTSENKKSLSQLLLEFLNYFANEYDFNNDVMSIRIGGVMTKNSARNCQSPKNNRGMWKFICIEEPFERTNTARSVFMEEPFQRILKTFQQSHDMLVRTKDLTSILNFNGV